MDSATERGYQSGFCQILAAEGHTVIHSTRHAPIEFGKDIISLDALNRPCAYQLKGNPGTRLSLASFREMVPQLYELLRMPIKHPSVAGRQHLSFLVTNGHVEEEVLLAIDNLNAGEREAGYPGRVLHLISRGELLKKANKLGSTLWPSDIVDVKPMLELMVDPGDGPLPLERIHSLLAGILKLSGDIPDKAHQRLASAAIALAVSLSSFQGRLNHLALAQAWAIYAFYAIATFERAAIRSTASDDTISLALNTAKSHLQDLASEALSLPSIVMHGGPADVVAIPGRATALAGYVALLWHWCEESDWPVDLQKAAVEKHLDGLIAHVECWGEAAIPQLLMYHWYRNRANRGEATKSDLEWMLHHLLLPVTGSNLIGGVPGAYYDYEYVARLRHNSILGATVNTSEADSPSAPSYFVESLYYLVVRTGYKLAAQSLWDKVSRRSRGSFIASNPWQQCLWRAEAGTNHDRRWEPRVAWADIVSNARQTSCDSIPRALLDNKFLLALFAMVFPHRATTGIILRLGWMFDPRWFIADPIVDSVSTTPQPGPVMAKVGRRRSLPKSKSKSR